MSVNRDSNDNNNNHGENLTDIKTEFEGLKTFLIEKLFYLKDNKLKS